MSIDIILGTYNGAVYLDEQIESLLAQKEQNWRLLIRDDGSTDDTVDIIQSYVEQYPDKISHVDMGGPNLGVVGNFARLLEESTADYVMFCDQDDRWYPDKITLTLKALSDMEIQYGTDIPLLVHTDARLVDESMQPTHASFHDALSHEPARTCLAYELIQNTAHGCTIMMNRALVQLALPVPKEARMHDMWVHLLTQSSGYADYLDVATLDYRQHGKNVIGALPQSHDAAQAKRKAGKTMAASIEQAKCILDRIGASADKDSRAVLEAFIQVPTLSWIAGTRRLLKQYCPKPKLKNTIRILLR